MIGFWAIVERLGYRLASFANKRYLQGDLQPTLQENQALMKFQLTIDCAGDAFDFEGHPNAEIATILRNLYNRVNIGDALNLGDSETIRDTNGNTCGKWELTA